MGEEFYMNSIRFCKKCKEYTMKATCSVCASAAIDPKPPKFSPLDKWGKYRREMKAAAKD